MCLRLQRRRRGARGRAPLNGDVPVPLSPRQRRALAVCALLACGAAKAQWGIGLGAESDHRFRGVSLSDGQPDAWLSLSYDHASGAFGGASATGVEFTRGRHALQLLGYAGYAMRLTSELGAEFGATHSTFRGNTRYDYTEVFAGLLSERWSLRAYHAPDYFGFGRATVYLEVVANAALAARLRGFGHVGVLHALGGGEPEAGRRTRTDLRVGLGYGVAQAIDLQLAWVAVTRGGPDVVGYGTRRNGVVVSALASF